MKWYSRDYKNIPEGSWSTFYFEKNVKSVYKLDKSEIDKKYDTLRNLNFKNVHIPSFSYKVKDHEITYCVEFIKGTQLNPLTYMTCVNDIYEGLVNNENEWGFEDLKCENFIAETITDKLYFIDFECFQWMTYDTKIKHYNKSVEHVRLNLNEMKKNIDMLNRHHFWK